jgi:hypothetical protein
VLQLPNHLRVVEVQLASELINSKFLTHEFAYSIPLFSLRNVL